MCVFHDVSLEGSVSVWEEKLKGKDRRETSQYICSFPLKFEPCEGTTC